MAAELNETMTQLNPTAAKWIAEGWEPQCQDDYEWATMTGQYAPEQVARKSRITDDDPSATASAWC